jgi:hypothetical protein
MTMTKEGYETFCRSGTSPHVFTKFTRKTSELVVKYARKFSENFAQMLPYGGDHLLQTCNNKSPLLALYLKHKRHIKSWADFFNYPFKITIMTFPQILHNLLRVCKIKHDSLL